jgi:hypothetical protein
MSKVNMCFSESVVQDSIYHLLFWWLTAEVVWIGHVVRKQAAQVFGVLSSLPLISPDVFLLKALVKLLGQVHNPLPNLKKINLKHCRPL